VVKGSSYGKTLGTGNMFEPTFGFKNLKKFQFKEYSYRQNYNPLDFYLPTRAKFAPPYASLDLLWNLLSDRLWVTLF
jgi:hypothetical protein